MDPSGWPLFIIVPLVRSTVPHGISTQAVARSGGKVADRAKDPSCMDQDPKTLESTETPGASQCDFDGYKYRNNLISWDIIPTTS